MQWAMVGLLMTGGSEKTGFGEGCDLRNVWTLETKKEASKGKGLRL